MRRLVGQVIRGERAGHVRHRYCLYGSVFQFECKNASSGNVAAVLYPSNYLNRGKLLEH